MKKILVPVFTSLAALTLQAQEPADALRASWAVPGGTARQQAIGGAMGSLGGDISATFVNPAGLAIYRTGDFVFSPRAVFGNNKADYYNRTEKESFNKFTWGTTGFVIGSGANRKGNNVAISIAYNRSADFNNKILYRGANNQTSYSQQYLEQLQNAGVLDSTAAYDFPYGPSLAINTYWIDPVKNSNGDVTGFKTNSPIATGLLQENSVESSGGVDEFAIGAGVSVSDKLMLGGTFGVPFLHYKRMGTFTEADATDNATNNFNYATIEDNLSTSGIGLNLKLGLIYKASEYLRLGLAFHSPTLYSLKDLYDVQITTDAEGASSQVLTDYSKDYSGGQQAEFSYSLTTPYRAILSASYVLREVADVSQQKGFLTADLEFVNYKAASFHTVDETTTDDKTYYNNLNTAVDNAYKPAFNLRVGGELKFTTLMVRAGAAYYGTPYQNINGEKGSKLNLSGGLGYRNKGVFVDLTYVHAITKDVHYAYRLETAPYAGARINGGVGNVVATVGFKL